jgi:Reverse transcriptase (RNA-dependent DNA polymerase)
LNYRLAYERVRDELLGQPKTERALAVNPFEIELVEQDLDSWISELQAKVDENRYVPGAIEVCDAPKGGGLVRPGVRLGITDRVVYTAAVGACLQRIDEATRWSQGSCDFASRLDPARLHERDWLRNPYKGWREFHDRSLQRLNRSSVSHVLTADVAGFFENINLGLLRSELARIGCPTAAINLIGLCLNHWAQCPDRGLPQGVIASDVLAKLYLEPFDKRLREASIDHMRYTDDLRIYAQSEEEAQRALVMITTVLRKRGLTLQSHKTLIRPAEEARKEFDGVIPAIEQVRQGYVKEAIAAGLMTGDVSLPMIAIDDLFGGKLEAAVLHRAFDTYIVRHKNPNKSMLNFLLGRLGCQRDDYAVEECVRRLASNPERTPSIARYFERLKQGERLEPLIAEALASQTAAIYPYQCYLLLDWLRRSMAQLAEETLAIVRQLAFRPESPPYVQAMGLELLGRFGTHADIDQIEERFKSTSEPLRRAQLLCCLRGLEKSRRNGLAARVDGEGGWVGRAASFTRT